jgi:hypothetical protein
MILPGLPFGLTAVEPQGLNLVAHSTSEGATVGALTFEPGFGSLRAGDVCLVYAFREGSTTRPTLPSGWTSLLDESQSTVSPVISGRVSQRNIGGAFITPVGVTFTNANINVCLVFRAVSAVAPWGTDDGDSPIIMGGEGSGGTLPFAVRPSGARDFQVSFSAIADNVTKVSVSAGTGKTLLREVSLTGANQFIVALVLQIDAGLTSVGDTSYRVSDDNTFIEAHLVLR